MEGKNMLRTYYNETLGIHYLKFNFENKKIQFSLSVERGSGDKILAINSEVNQFVENLFKLEADSQKEFNSFEESTDAHEVRKNNSPKPSNYDNIIVSSRDNQEKINATSYADFVDKKLFIFAGNTEELDEERENDACMFEDFVFPDTNFDLEN
jgi:hypothetical protein